MLRPSKLLSAAALWTLLPLSAFAQTAQATVPAPQATVLAPPQKPAVPGREIFDPNSAPLIVIEIKGRRIVLVPAAVPTVSGSTTTVSAQAIASKANNTTFSSVIAAAVPGAAQSSSGELHIRGSHGQYTYYLDGAPLPSSVSGSFSDLIDPRNIQNLRVYTGGFPAKYGDNLAAVFDVSAKGGVTKGTDGLAQQIAQGYGTYQTTVQVGSKSPFSWFMSGVRRSTDRRLDPLTQEPLHDAGSDSVVFTKLSSTVGTNKTLTFDGARTDSRFQIPNDIDRQAVGQDDVQRENGNFGNLIYHVAAPKEDLIVALYSHASRLRFSGSPADLTPAPGTTSPDGLISTQEDRIANYAGLRVDNERTVNSQHKLGYGLDASTVTGSEHFRLASADENLPVVDNHNLSGGDRSAYVQDDWTPSRSLLVNFGARYDIHKAQDETSQLSPRFNVTFHAGSRDTFHAYYDRLFQPAAVEDVRHLNGSTAVGDTTVTTIKPERNNFYEVGWQHSFTKATFGVNAYYKTAKDVIDDQPLGQTQITVPFNVEKGYVRGVEVSVSGSAVPGLSYYANYARAWAFSAGRISGGILSTDPPAGYFPVDHDQTHTASLGMDFDRRGLLASWDGEYGSGFPYQDDAGVFRRVSPHFVFNSAIGTRIGSSAVLLTTDNILNHSYIIKQAGTFTNREWGQARTFGVRWTQSFLIKTPHFMFR